jgi:hypothetical protein
VDVSDIDAGTCGEETTDLQDAYARGVLSRKCKLKGTSVLWNSNSAPTKVLKASTLSFLSRNQFSRQTGQAHTGSIFAVTGTAMTVLQSLPEHSKTIFVMSSGEMLVVCSVVTSRRVSSLFPASFLTWEVAAS